MQNIITINNLINILHFSRSITLKFCLCSKRINVWLWDYG